MSLFTLTFFKSSQQSKQVFGYAILAFAVTKAIALSLCFLSERMSVTQADKVKRPLLLVHGEDDNNTGTFPMQSERFYAALKGHGAAARLVLLPHESHGYSARESVMHVLAEMDAWLRAYCEAPQSKL